MLVLAILVLMTNISRKIVRKPYIYELIQFQQDKKLVKVMYNNSSKINVMNLDFSKKIGFFIQNIKIEVQKTNDFTFKTFEIMIAKFQIKDMISRPRFFQEIFLIAYIKIEMMLRIYFLTISYANM